MNLYPEQETWLSAVRDELDKSPSVCAQAPVAFGKTQCFVAMTKGALEQDHKVLILAPKKELIAQISDRLLLFGIPHGFYAGDYPELPGEQVQIATPQSALNKAPLEKFSLVIEDECHNAVSEGYLKLHKRLTGAEYRVGVTATPCRLDGKGLRLAYQSFVPGPQPEGLIQIGRLARPVVYSLPTPDLSALKKSGPDFSRASLEAALNTKQHRADVVLAYEKYCPGMQALVYVATVKHAYDLAERFRANGHSAEVLEGAQATAERREITARFAVRKTKILISVDLITEGFDVPGVEVVIMDRKTQSLRLFIQAAGRAMRGDGGRKTECMILDLVGNVYRHGLPDADREWSLEGGQGKASDKGMGIKQCKWCYRWCDVAIKACPGCGEKYVGKERKYRHGTTGTLEVVKEAKPKAVTKHDLFKAEIKGAKSYEEVAAAAEKYGYSKEYARIQWSFKEQGRNKTWMRNRWRKKSKRIS